MNRLLITVLITLSAFAGAMADTWFPYPTPPEILPLGRPRANYIVEHFWDRCPWKSAYSSTAKMEETLRDFATFIPHAAADTTFLSIETLIKNTQKKPADFATLLKLAEATFYSDTAKTFSDVVYRPFAEAGATFKKFKPEQRNFYARQLKIIDNSMLNNPVAQLPVVAADGTVTNLNDTTPGVQTYILIFERPDDDHFDRVMFSANISVNKLIEAGLIQPILICAGEPTEEWWASTKRLPEGWRAVAMKNADTEMKLGNMPSVYLADAEMKIISKFMPLDILIYNCEQLVTNAGL